MFNGEVFSYLELLYSQGTKRGHKVLLQILEKLDNPQEKISICHVAGTNGKGSVCAMLHSILTEHGFLVGQFSSPHLESPKERFVYGNQMISEVEFALGTKIIQKAQQAVFGDERMVSYFEFLTIMAFWFFDLKEVDFLLLEAGIGGRLDSTNLIQAPLVSIITSIDFDHIDILGNSILSIATEKAGIIKENGKVAVYTDNVDVLQAINTEVDKKNAILYNMIDADISLISQDIESMVFTVKGGLFSSMEITLEMIGKYQINNAMTVLGALGALKDGGLTLYRDKILAGFRKARWPGRMEIVDKEPLIMLDGAHNVGGGRAFVDSLRGLSSIIPRETILIVGILSDKDHKELLEILSELADTIIVTEANSYRAFDGNQLLHEMEEISTRKQINKQLYVEKKPVNALHLAKELARKQPISSILIAGSLYLVGELREIIMDEKQIKSQE